MAIALNETDWNELCGIAQQQGETIYRQTPNYTLVNLPQKLGTGGERTIFLRHGLILSTRHCMLHQDIDLKRSHHPSFPLTAKFILSGCSRVQTAHVPSVADDYEEAIGHHYLYCLPDLTEIEAWRADESIQVVMIYADLDYFRQFLPHDSILLEPLKNLIEKHEIVPFHHPLGRITPAMLQVLQQILACPYQGFMQNLYLEGKALELLALQFTQWTKLSARSHSSTISLRSDDLDRLHAAQAILIQRASDPPSLIELARQVGLNDRKLKQGFLQVFGTTVFGYLQDYRLERSRQLLGSGDLNVTEVAHLVGYASLPSFSKAFRKKFGTSPITYCPRHSVKKVRLG